MKPTKLNLTRFGSRSFPRASRVLSVLSAAVLFTGCYTKLASSGDHWGYTGPIKEKVVVRETEDTIVVKETRVIHQPQPVVTDTVTYTNTSTGEENVVVNNYFAPPPATFGAYDPWTNTYPTWYDDYWYRPQAAIVISIGDPYYYHHHSRWFDHHWRRHSYYQSYWDYNYYYPWNGWYHASYRGPGWAYYDPYYPYPPVYGYGYGCYVPVYDPFYDPFYGHGYYGGYYGGHYGHGHHGYYGDNDDDGRDDNGRERRRGNVGGEERGRGGTASDGGSPNTGVTLPKDGSSPVRLPEADGVRAIPVSGGASRNVGTTTATNGGNFNGGDSKPDSGKGVGRVDISTGSIPVDAASDPGYRGTTDVRELKNSPAHSAPGVYQAPAVRNSTTPGGTASQPTERRPAEQVSTTRTTTAAPTNVVKTTDASNVTRSATVSEPRTTARSSSSASPAPAKSTGSQSSGSQRTSTTSPSYTPRSSSASSSVSNAGSSSSSGRAAGSGSTANSGSSSRGSDSRSSESRGSDSRGSDSRSNSDGGRARR